MAIYIRPVDTWSGPTLMGRILPGPINYRAGYGFFLKPETGLGRVRVLCISGPNSTRIHIIYYKKKECYFLLHIIFFEGIIHSLVDGFESKRFARLVGRQSKLICLERSNEFLDLDLIQIFTFF